MDIIIKHFEEKEYKKNKLDELIISSYLFEETKPRVFVGNFLL